MFDSRSRAMSLTLNTVFQKNSYAAAIAQLGERQTEDLKVPGSIPGLGMLEASPAHGAMAAEPCCGNVDVIQTVRRP